MRSDPPAAAARQPGGAGPARVTGVPTVRGGWLGGRLGLVLRPRFGPPLRAFLQRHHLDWRKREVALYYGVAALLALGALTGVAAQAGFGTVWALLAHPEWLWLLAALAGTAVSYPGYMLAYREVARARHGGRLAASKVGALVATGFGAFVPHGGFTFDVQALCDLGVPTRDARVRVLGLGALEYVVLAPAAVVSALVLLFGGDGSDSSVTLPWLIGVPVGGVLTALAMAPALRLRDRLSERTRVQAALRRSLDALEEVFALRHEPLAAVAAVGGMTIYWAGEICALWACLAAFVPGRAPSLPAVIVGYATGYALTRRTLPLAGAGVTEALLPFALTWVGVALAPAALAVFAYRVFNMWLPVAPALLGLKALRKRPARRDAGRGTNRFRSARGRPVRR